jgi:hypothetical protein
VIAGRSGRVCTCLARISAGGSSSSVLNASESARGCSVTVVVLTLAKRSGAGANDRERMAMSETGVPPHCTGQRHCTDRRPGRARLGAADERGDAARPIRDNGAAFQPGKTGVSCQIVAKAWMCRLGVHKYVKRHDSPDPSHRVCIRCRRQRPGMAWSELFARFGVGG